MKMKYFTYVEGGIRKCYSWGYSERKAGNLADCFTPDELLQVIETLGKVDLGVDDKDLLAKAKFKWKERKKQ